MIQLLVLSWDCNELDVKIRILQYFNLKIYYFLLYSKNGNF